MTNRIVGPTDAGGMGVLVALAMLALGLALAGAGLGLTYLPAPWGLAACAPLLVGLGAGACRLAHWARRRAEVRDMREIAREIVARSREGGGRWLQ